MELKPCKICGAKRYANTSWCYSCYRKREKEKKEEKARLKKEKKEGTKKFQQSLKKKLHGIAWRLMSEWVRRKDANPDGFNECYTCDTPLHYKQLQAGHFKHGRLDFDERNLKPQCAQCNKYYSGRLDVYAERLIKDNGLFWFDRLVADAWQHKGYSVEDLKKIIEDLKVKISNLE